MSSPGVVGSPEELSFDYTEGASALDIQDAAVSQNQTRRRPRRDSQIGQSYAENDDDNDAGAVFDGPGSVTMPSSVSRMSRREMSKDRSRMLRRMSNDFEPGPSRPRFAPGHSGASEAEQQERPTRARRDSGGSVVSSVVDTEDDNALASSREEDTAASGRRSHRRRSVSPSANRSMFDSFVHMFGGGKSTEDQPTHRSTRSISSGHSRQSSQRSDRGSDYAVESDDDLERWGYSSGEEDSEDDQLLGHDRSLAETNNPYSSDLDYGSAPPSPTGSLPNMALDPIFGDTRIDFDTSPERPEDSRQGPPSRQTIFLRDEDTNIRFIGYEQNVVKLWLWRMASVLSFGVLSLLGHWFPRLWLRFVLFEKAFKDINQGYIVVEV